MNRQVIITLTNGTVIKGTPIGGVPQLATLRGRLVTLADATVSNGHASHRSLHVTIDGSAVTSVGT